MSANFTWNMGSKRSAEASAPPRRCAPWMGRSSSRPQEPRMRKQSTTTRAVAPGSESSACGGRAKVSFMIDSQPGSAETSAAAVSHVSTRFTSPPGLD